MNEHVKSVKKTGQDLYKIFIEERLEKRSVPITDVISKNRLSLFSSPYKKTKSKSASQIFVVKSNCELFSRMYISCQSKNGGMDEFFKHENTSAPPSLADNGVKRFGTKSDLLECMESYASSTKIKPMVNAEVLDGLTLVHMLMPHKCKFFDDYAGKVFLPQMLKKLESVDRLNIIWDRYLPQSLKQAARQKRGSSCHVQVRQCTPILSNWGTFLELEQNKTKPFHFLAKHIGSVATEVKQLCTTLENNIVCATHINNVHDLAPFDHEELIPGSFSILFIVPRKDMIRSS